MVKKSTSKSKIVGEVKTRDFDERIKLEKEGYVLKEIITGKTNQDKTYVMKK